MQPKYCHYTTTNTTTVHVANTKHVYFVNVIELRPGQQPIRSAYGIHVLDSDYLSEAFFKHQNWSRQGRRTSLTWPDAIRSDWTGLAAKFFSSAFFHFNKMFVQMHFCYGDHVLLVALVCCRMKRCNELFFILVSKHEQFRENVIKCWLVAYAQQFRFNIYAHPFTQWVSACTGILLDITIISPVYGVRWALHNLKFILKLKSPTKWQKVWSTSDHSSRQTHQQTDEVKPFT